MRQLPKVKMKVMKPMKVEKPINFASKVKEPNAGIPHLQNIAMARLKG